ncbi:MAG: pilin [Candidatus Komeilibacteria bacterium]|nr:pilin [Candidatus Komeilibacteria bacterium]
MKSVKIVLLSFYLLGLGFIVVPQNALAQGFIGPSEDSGKCCICREINRSAGDDREVRSCTRYITQATCESQGVVIANPNLDPSQTGLVGGVTCSLDYCYNSDLCPAPSAVGERAIPREDLKFTPNISLPGFPKTSNVDNSLLGNYISALYKFLVGVAGIVAVIMIAIGGLLWLFSSGDSGKITKAKEIIIGAIIGLILVLGSWLILNTINPKLVEFSPLDVSKINKSQVGDFCEPDAAVTVDGKDDIGQNLSCGQKAKVKGTNQECIGRGCSEYLDGAVCYFNQRLGEANCLKCDQVDNTTMDKYGIPKNENGCNLFTPTFQETNRK